VPSHAAVDSALTAGFGAAFEVGGLVALAGFVISLIAVRGRVRNAEMEVITEAA